MDKVEQLAIDRAKALFGAEHANVQPHSGSQANMAVYLTALKPGDTILGMDLSHGGHLTHGHPLSFSGSDYKVVAYGVRREDERIDYDELAALAREHRPKLIIAGASAYSREIDFARFGEIADGGRRGAHVRHRAHRRPRDRRSAPVARCRTPPSSRPRRTRRCAARAGAWSSAAAEHAKDLDRNVFPGIQGGPLEHVIAAKAVAFAEAAAPDFDDYQRRVVENARALAAALSARGFRLVSGGTDNHLMLVDVGAKGISGKDAEKRLDARRASPSTRTRSPSTRARRWSPPASGSERRRSRRAGWARRRWRRSPPPSRGCSRPGDDAAAASEAKRSVAELCAAFPLV